MIVKKKEYDKLMKKVDYLEKEIKSIKEKGYITWIDADEQFRKAKDLLCLVVDDRTESLGNLIESKIDENVTKIKSSLPSIIEDIIKSSKFQDTLLLRVVKATFNNYKDE